MSKNGIGFFADDVPAEVIFAGKKVIFDERMYRYAAAEAEFAPQAIKSIEKMNANFADEIGSLDDFLRQGGGWIYRSLSDFLDFTMEQLSLNGCYSLDKKTFFEQYVAGKIEVTPRIYEQMQKVYDAIEERQAAKNEQRVMERKLHVLEGKNEIGEMLWNGVKRGADEIKNKSQKSGYYNRDVQLQIKQEYRFICISMVDSFADALLDSEHVDLRSPISAEDYKRTSVMFDNLAAGKIPESRVDDVALEIFEKNPILPNFLDWAVARYGDPDGEMQKTADAFHVSIEGTKAELLQQVFESLDFSSEQNTLAGKKVLEKEEKRLRYTCGEYTDSIEKRLAEFDLAARTVDGIEYDSREKAQKAAKLKSLLDKIDYSSEESTLAGQKEYLALEAEIGLTVPKYRKKLEKKLQEFDSAAKTVDGIEYDSREKAQKAAKLKEAFGKIDFSSEESTLAGRKEYLALEAEIGLTVAKYREELDKKLQDFDLAARTFNGVEYDSREKAAEVRRQTEELFQMLDEAKFDTEEQVQSLIDTIRQKNYTIPIAEKAKERLGIRVEMLKHYPLNHIEITRLLLLPKFKLIIAVSLWLVTGAFFLIPALGILFMVLYLLWLASLFFTTRKNFAQYMDMFIQKKNYKYAAVCYELSYQSIRDFIGVFPKDMNKGKD